MNRIYVVVSFFMVMLFSILAYSAERSVSNTLNKTDKIKKTTNSQDESDTANNLVAEVIKQNRQKRL